MHTTFCKWHTVGLTLLFVFSASCGRKSADSSSASSAEVNDSLPGAVKKLVQAVTDNDSSSFASIVSYPLQRPYPLHDIESEEQMRGYYKEMVDDSLRNIISHSTSKQWDEQGWRGWTLDNGQYVWADDSVYDVPYVSQRERALIDSLTRNEIESIAPAIRKGWKPILCYQDDGLEKVYRIDERTDTATRVNNKYRLALYNKPESLKQVPSRLLMGFLEVSGSAQTVTYTFDSGKGETLMIEPDSPETGTPVLYLPGDSIVLLHRAYWHELVSATPDSN